MSFFDEWMAEREESMRWKAPKWKRSVSALVICGGTMSIYTATKMLKLYTLRVDSIIFTSFDSH